MAVHRRAAYKPCPLRQHLKHAAFLEVDPQVFRANVLLLDEPTNHLDLESITALNNGLIAFKGTVLFVSHDHEFVQTIANRIIDITPDGVVDRLSTYDDFLANETVRQQLQEKYKK